LDGFFYFKLVSPSKFFVSTNAIPPGAEDPNNSMSQGKYSSHLTLMISPTLILCHYFG
jgi:hypothetical protein